MATQKADVGRCQLTNCPHRHLDLSLTFLVPLILSSVPEPGPLTHTELCSGLLAVSCGDTDKENLSQPSRTPVPSLPEIVASHAGQNWFMCSAGRSSLRFRTGGREPPRKRKAQVLRTGGIWRGDPQSLSGGPSCFPAHLTPRLLPGVPSPPLPQAFVCPHMNDLPDPNLPTGHPMPIQPGCSSRHSPSTFQFTNSVFQAGSKPGVPPKDPASPHWRWWTL